MSAKRKSMSTNRSFPKIYFVLGIGFLLWEVALIVNVLRGRYPFNPSDVPFFIGQLLGFIVVPVIGIILIRKATRIKRERQKNYTK